MKFYSEMLDKIFDKEEDLIEAEAAKRAAEVAEAEAKARLKEEKDARMAEIKVAYEEYKDAEAHYRSLINDYLKDYKKIHFQTNSSHESNDVLKALTDYFKIFGSKLPF